MLLERNDFAKGHQGALVVDLRRLEAQVLAQQIDRVEAGARRLIALDADQNRAMALIGMVVEVVHKRRHLRHKDRQRGLRPNNEVVVAQQRLSQIKVFVDRRQGIARIPLNGLSDIALYSHHGDRCQGLNEADALSKERN